MHDAHLRICAVCRKVSPASECTVENAKKVYIERASGDQLGSMDSSAVWVDQSFVAPEFPCDSCGKETKAHHEEGKRSCRPCGRIQ